MYKLWKATFAAIDLKYAVIKVKDGSSPVNELEVVIGEGNLTYTERRELIYETDRGLLDEVRLGDEQPMDVTIDFRWDYITALTGSGTPTIEEAIKKKGEAAAWVSTDSDACRPYAVDLEVTYTPNCSPTGNTEVITLPDFRYDDLSHDISAASISCTGRCNAVEAVAVRS
jgi:hypothetical protein